MNKKIILIILLIVVTMSSFPLFSADISGYIEPQYTGFYFVDNYYQLSSNKLRIDISNEFSENVNFSADIIYISYDGKTSWSIKDFLNDDITATLPDAYSNVTLEFEDEIKLDNAYIQFMTKRSDITIGKQQIALGTGYAWNPIDVFNQKELVDPAYEKPGNNLIRIDIPIKGRWNSSFIYEPEERYENSGKMARLKGGLGRFDFSFNLIQKYRTLSDIINLTAIQQRRDIYGFDLVGEILGIGVWTEYGYNEVPGSDDFSSLVSGCDYTLNSGTYMMGEYFFYGEGESKKEEYDLNTWVRYLEGETDAISRQQVYLMVTHPVSEHVQMGISAITSIGEYDTVLIPTLTASLTQDTELSLFGNINTGSDGTVFDRELGSGILARLRAYF